MERFKHGLLIAAVAIAVAALLDWSSGWWLAPLAKRWLVSTANRQTGLSWSVAQVEGSYASSLVLTRIAAQGKAPDVVRSFSAERLELHYSLLDYLFHREKFWRGLRIRMLGGEAVLDVTADRADPRPAPGVRPVKPLSLPAWLVHPPEFHIHDTRLTLRAPGFTLQRAWVQASGGRSGNRLLLFSEAWQPPAFLGDGARPLALSMGWRPGQITLTSLFTCEGFEIEKAWINYGPARKPAIGFGIQARMLGGWMAAKGSFDGYQAVAKIETRGLRAAPLLRLAGWHPPAELCWSANAQIALDRRKPALACGRLGLNVRGPVRAGPKLALSAHAFQGVLRVRKIKGSWRTAWLQSEQLRFAMAPLIQGRWSSLLRSGAGCFQAGVEHLPTLFGNRESGNFPAHRLVLAGNFQNGRLVFPTFALQVSNTRLAFNRFLVDWPEDAASLGQARLEGRLKTAVADLQKVLEGWGPDLRGQAKLQARLAGTIAHPQAWADFQFREVSAGPPEDGVLAERIFGNLSIQGGDQVLAMATIRMQGSRIDPGRPLPAIHPERFTLRWQQGVLHAESIRGTVGDEPFASSGYLRLTGAGAPWLELDLSGRDILLIADEGMRIRTDLALHGRGRLPDLTLSGAAVVTGGQYNAPIDLQDLLSGDHVAAPRRFRLFSIATQPFRDWRFRAEFTARRPLRVLNNLAIGALWPFVRLGGTGGQPDLDGHFLVGASQLALTTGAIQLGTGLITFPKGVPGQPVLNLQGRTRVQGYGLSVLARGWLSAPVIQYLSQPRLGQAEAVLLGLTGAPLEQVVESDLGLPTGFVYASYLSKGILTRWPSLGMLGNLLVNPLQVESGLDPNGVAGISSFNTQFLLNTQSLAGATLYLTSNWSPFDTVSLGVKLAFPLE